MLLALLAYRRDWTAPSGTLLRTACAVAAAGLVLAAFAFFAEAPLAGLTAALPVWRSETLLGLLGLGGGILYGLVLLLGLKLLRVRLSRS